MRRRTPVSWDRDDVLGDQGSADGPVDRGRSPSATEFELDGQKERMARLLGTMNQSAAERRRALQALFHTAEERFLEELQDSSDEGDAGEALPQYQSQPQSPVGIEQLLQLLVSGGNRLAGIFGEVLEGTEWCCCFCYCWWWC